MMRLARTAGYIAALSLAGALTLACGTASEQAEQAENAGVIGLNLSLGAGVDIDSQSYTIIGPNGFSKTGTIDLSAATQYSATIGGIPTGNGYSITLSGASSAGSATCSGSASFNVVARQTTQVAVAVECHLAPKNGSVQVSATTNQCPVVDELTATPDNAYLGSSVALAAQAHDPDAAPGTLVYNWTASAGSLSSSIGSNPTFTCTAPGAAVITLTATDGSGNCTDAQSVIINCSVDASATFYTTKTPYRPHQTIASYEAPPSGFSTVFTELVARHGSRGLSSVKYDAAALNMWKKASDDGALTSLAPRSAPTSRS